MNKFPKKYAFAYFCLHYSITDHNKEFVVLQYWFKIDLKFEDIIKLKLSIGPGRTVRISSYYNARLKW